MTQQNQLDYIINQKVGFIHRHIYLKYLYHSAFDSFFNKTNNLSNKYKQVGNKLVKSTLG